MLVRERSFSPDTYVKSKPGDIFSASSKESSSVAFWDSISFSSGSSIVIMIASGVTPAFLPWCLLVMIPSFVTSCFYLLGRKVNSTVDRFALSITVGQSSEVRITPFSTTSSSSSRSVNTSHNVVGRLTDKPSCTVSWPQTPRPIPSEIVDTQVEMFFVLTRR